MASIQGLIIIVIGLVIAITLVPTIWDTVWSDSVTTPGGNTVNGTTWTLLKLVPMVFVGAVIVGFALQAIRE